MNKKNKYNFAVDGLRFLAILAVVTIHTTTRTLEGSMFGVDKYIFTFFLNQAARFAVPLFFMISGFVLEANYQFHQNYFSYLKKRLTRIFLPYLFWSLIYFLFIYPQPNGSFISALETGSASYQLYFIPSLLIFYIVFPFIHKIYKLISNRYVLIILTVLQIALLGYEYYIKTIPLYFPLSIALFNCSVFIFGMIASRNQKWIQKFAQKWRVALTIGSIILAFVVFNEGRVLYLSTHNYLYFYSSWRPSILVYTVVFALILYLVFDKAKGIHTKVQTLSRLSFFVFFIHVIILELTWKTFFQSIFQSGDSLPFFHIWFDPLFLLAVISLSYLIAYFAHKIPNFSKISG